MARPRQRIPVNGPQGGLPGAFANLELDGLPQFSEPSGNVEASDPSVDDSPSTVPGKSKGRVVLSRLKAHRAGKVVIAIEGFDARHSVSDIEDLAKRLRAACGCGGTVVGRVVEVQGDQASRVRGFLEAQGFQVAGVR